MNKKYRCYLCDEEVDKIALGLNRKILGSKVTRFYCINCLSEHLEVSVEDLLEKAEEFKSQGCKQF